ncbi:MAG: SAP domain-containing protein, partial [Poseidonia sp.]
DGDDAEEGDAEEEAAEGEPEAEPAAVEDAAPAEEPAPAEEAGADYDSMTVAELKELLKAAGKPVSGKKADLIARLNE